MLHRCAGELVGDEDALAHLSSAVEHADCSAFWRFAACSRVASACFELHAAPGGPLAKFASAALGAWNRCSNYTTDFGEKLDFQRVLKCDEKIRARCPPKNFPLEKDKKPADCTNNFYEGFTKHLAECGRLEPAEHLLLCDVRSFFLVVQCAEPARCPHSVVSGAVRLVLSFC
ncbi:hypothetical protein M3Y99_01512300 [Aphelenchoides fujianensis]|nr:hypothetical protein M3Y99_01512300 [Aphelenchoides fujianensis]